MVFLGAREGYGLSNSVVLLNLRAVDNAIKLDTVDTVETLHSML